MTTFTPFTSFASGYVDSARRTLPEYQRDAQLSDEAREMILADCARWSDEYGDPEGDDAVDGALFWGTRQIGEWADVAFPPLTISLNNDGKIVLAVKS